MSADLRVRLVPGGLDIGGKTVPLYAGSVHYWRLEPGDWKPCLEATKALGLKFIDTYVPWSVHEVAPGQFDFGELDPRRDIGRFVRMAGELGLFVIVRPGPHINAELTHFGIPERVVWDPSAQARTANNNPVMLPMLPVAFPVPSYASEAFHDEAARYFRALGKVLEPLRYPEGPIVLVQVDNEGALYFRDGAYDQDYHPDAIRLYRDFLREKYKTLDALKAAYGALTQDAQESGAEGEKQNAEEPRFATLMPPSSFDATRPEEVVRHMDWCEFHEHLLATAFHRFARALHDAGFGGLPTTHNLPLGQETTPLNPARVSRVVDLVGLDYYNLANNTSRMSIARRTSELAVRCEGLRAPPFACEMGAGFPPFFPPLEERDTAFTVLAALAYGLRGFNVYMAVERDRWIGAPIDSKGRPRASATFWRRLCEGLVRTDFHTLRRATPVRILTPRSQRRLQRAMHAFGPLSGAMFSIAGAGPRESCLEDDLAAGYPIAFEADTFVRAFEAALEARGVPFAHIGGEDRNVSIQGARWIICATSGGVNPNLLKALVGASREGAQITLGPRRPVFDGLLRPWDHSKELRELESLGSVALYVADDPASVDAAVSLAIQAQRLPAIACDPDGIFASVHEDHAGTPRVLFVLNPGDTDIVARIAIGPSSTTATDVLEHVDFAIERGTVEIRMQRHSVRMLALS